VTFAGTSDLTTAIPLSGSGTVVITVEGQLAGTAAELFGSSTVDLLGAGSLTTQIRLSGAPQIAVTGLGSLSTAIQMAGAGTITVTAGSALTVQPRPSAVADVTVVVPVKAQTIIVTEDGYTVVSSEPRTIIVP